MENKSETKGKEKRKLKDYESKKRKGKGDKKVLKSARQKDVFDHWVLFQLLSIFAFSFAMGMLFMHATILWHQYKGYGYWARHATSLERVFRDHVDSRFSAGASHIYEWSHGQLRVNTSLYVR